MKLSPELHERACRLLEAEIIDGKELNNPTPLVVSTGLGRPLTLAQQIERILNHKLSREASRQGYETLEESEDFDVDDGFDTDMPVTVHEMADELLTAAKMAPAKPATSDQPHEAIVNPTASNGASTPNNEPATQPPPNQPGGSVANGSS